MVRLLTPEELAEILGVSVHTVYQYTSKRRIPYIKIGKLIRFSETEIEEWLEANTMETKSRLFERIRTDGKTLPKR